MKILVLFKFGWNYVLIIDDLVMVELGMQRIFVILFISWYFMYCNYFFKRIGNIWEIKIFFRFGKSKIIINNYFGSNLSEIENVVLD